MRRRSTFVVKDCGHAIVGTRTRTTSEQEERSKAAAQAHLIQVNIAVHPGLNPWVADQVDKAVCHSELFAGLVYRINVL